MNLYEYKMIVGTGFGFLATVAWLRLGNNPKTRRFGMFLSAGLAVGGLLLTELG